MKIFIAALGAESNSFGYRTTELSDFAQCCLVRPGEASFGNTANDGHRIFAEWARGNRFSVTMGTLAYAMPSGPLTRDCYESLRDEIVNQLKQTLPQDIVLLNLHGAMLADGYDDCEGDLLSRIRAVCGLNTIVAGLLDPHAHLSLLMLQKADILLAYKYYPHTDVKESALRLADLALRTARGEAKPRMYAFDCRSIGTFPTTTLALQDYVREFQHLYQSGHLLDVSLIHSFPWGDSPDMGVKVLAIGDGDLDAARNESLYLARKFVANREHYAQRFIPLEKALEEASRNAGRPTVMADSADNPGGGAPGDSTFILRELIRRDSEKSAIAIIFDPAAMDAIETAGEGEHIFLSLGGKLSRLSGAPIGCVAQILSIRNDVEQTFGDAGDVRSLPLGRAAAIRIGSVDVIVSDTRSQVFSPECFSAFGLDPRDYEILVVKSSNHFRAGFEGLAFQILNVETPGPLTHDLHSLPYRRIRRPIWPLDESEASVTDMHGAPCPKNLALTGVSE